MAKNSPRLILTEGQKGNTQLNRKRSMPPRTRLFIEITQEEKKIFDRIPWGLRSKMWKPIVAQLLRLFESEGPEKVITRIILGEISLEELAKRTPASLAKELVETAHKEEAISGHTGTAETEHQ